MVQSKKLALARLLPGTWCAGLTHVFTNSKSRISTRKGDQLMRNFYGLVAFVAIGVAACSDGTGPSAAPQFSRQITFPDLHTKLNGLPANGAARAEIELPPTGFVAREVNVEDHEEVDDHESVRGEITALTVSGDNGTLTLAPGFKVTFTSTSMFETDDDTSLTFQQFVDRVQAALGPTPAGNLGVRPA